MSASHRVSMIMTVGWYCQSALLLMSGVLKLAWPEDAIRSLALMIPMYQGRAGVVIIASLVETALGMLGIICGMRIGVAICTCVCCAGFVVVHMARDTSHACGCFGRFRVPDSLVLTSVVVCAIESAGVV